MSYIITFAIHYTQYLICPIVLIVDCQSNCLQSISIVVQPVFLFNLLSIQDFVFCIENLLLFLPIQ